MPGSFACLLFRSFTGSTWRLLGDLLGCLLNCLLRRLLCRSLLGCLLGGSFLCCFLYGQLFTSFGGFTGALFGRCLLGFGLSTLNASTAFLGGGLLCGLFGHSFFRGCLFGGGLFGRSLLGTAFLAGAFLAAFFAGCGRTLRQDRCLRHALIVIGGSKHAGSVSISSSSSSKPSSWSVSIPPGSVMSSSVTHCVHLEHFIHSHCLQRLAAARMLRR